MLRTENWAWRGVRAAGLSACMVLIGACASHTPVTDATETPLLALQVAQALAGRYTNLAQWRHQGAEAQGPVELQVSFASSGSDLGQQLELLQRQQGRPERRFLLELQPSPVAGRLSGRFAPLTPSGQARVYCPMQFTVRSDGFAGQTDPESCRFAAGDRAQSLIKEIAYDGRQLVIADRLVDALSGEVLGEDQILRMHRIDPYTGWAGVREHDGQWRLAEGVRADSSGSAFLLHDAGGMPLALRIELGPHFIRPGEPAILRLSVYDADSGELHGRAWSALDAEQIGLALPDLQIGLTRVD